MAKRPKKSDNSVFKLMREIFSGTKSEAEKKAEEILKREYPTGGIPKTIRRTKQEEVSINRLDR